MPSRHIQQNAARKKKCNIPATTAHPTWGWERWKSTWWLWKLTLSRMNMGKKQEELLYHLFKSFSNCAVCDCCRCFENLCRQQGVIVFTLFSVFVMPARKITLAMKRLMQRCRWMVVLGLWMERIIENVRMQRNRQISERDRPTQVMSCNSKWFWWKRNNCYVSTYGPESKFKHTIIIRLWKKKSLNLYFVEGHKHSKAAQVFTGTHCIFWV